MSKQALIINAENSVHLVCELPRLLKKGGYYVTVMGQSHWLLSSSSIDERIPGPASPIELIAAAALLIAKRPFDLKILSCDALNWALLDSGMDLALKMELSPIKNLDYLYALEGKVGAAQMRKTLGISSPPSQPARSLEEAAEIASELGFPVILKRSRSGAGLGVVKCSAMQEVMQASLATDHPFLVEKFLEGDLISVEPLFLDSRLAAYSYSMKTCSENEYSPSLERVMMPCPEVEPILHTLGKELQLSGIFNLTFLRENRSGKHTLFEIDFRPTRWVRHGELAGVDWSLALRDPSAPLQRPAITKTIRHFPEDLKHAVKTKQLDRILYWALNRNRSWGSLPFRDLKFLSTMGAHSIKKILRRLLRPRRV